MSEEKKDTKGEKTKAGIDIKVIKPPAITSPTLTRIYAEKKKK